jgi:16S rRNA (cytosine967-C5)-methyltransferase
VQDALALAIEALSWMEHEGLSERAAFARAMRQLRVTQPDQLRTAQLLILETSRRRNFIDYLIQKAFGARFDPNSLQHGITSFMRIFCYWAKFHGASDNDLVRILHAARSVLGWKTMYPSEYLFGRILASDLREATAGLSADEALALDLFHPAWFADACTGLLGRSAALKLMRRNLRAASSYIRLSTLRGSEEACLREIERAGIKVEPVDKLPLTFKVLSSNRPIVRTEPYRDGRIVVQDKGSILASVVAAPKPGEIALDICAAPGAKSTHLAQLMQNKGVIYSIEKSPDRMSFWRKEVSRLGVEIAHPLLADARKPLPINVEADVVVLDPPCSNTGTFWKSPAAKWVVTPQRVRQLAETQWAMLENAARFVREGGTLVYSTCTVLAEEDEQIVNRFLRVNPDFKAVDSSPRLGLPGIYGLEKSQRLYPHVHDCNGHFLSKMKRVD